MKIMRLLRINETENMYYYQENIIFQDNEKENMSYEYIRARLLLANEKILRSAISCALRLKRRKNTVSYIEWKL